MSLRIQMLLIVLLVALLFIIIGMIKKRQLELKYILVWFACDIILIIFALFPGAMDKLSKMLGIYSPMNMIFFVGFVIAFIIIFALTAILSRVTTRVRRIAQALALLSEEEKKDIVDKEK